MIDQVKAYLESEEGGRWLLSTIAGAKYQENQRRHYVYDEPTYSREMEQEKKRQERIKALETAIPVSFYRVDVLDMVRFNQEKHPGEHKNGMIVNDHGKIILHTQGKSFPDLPIIQYDYWEDIINQGEGEAIDNKKQHWYITLID